MSIEIKSLAGVSIAELTATFNEAFEGYFVSINFTEAYKQIRLQRARVDLSASVGAFADGRLVAFILSGIDEWQGLPTAYNAGTGVIQNYRRQSLVRRMYDFLLPLYRERGLRQCTLEVIQENEYAIRAYRGVGMEIVRELLSFSGKLSAEEPLPEGFRWQQLDRPNWEAYRRLHAFEYSWDHNRSGTERSLPEYQCFELREGSTLAGFCILKPADGTIIQAGVREQDWAQTGRLLFSALAKEAPSVRWINIDSRATELLTCLRELGFTPLINQYEMHMLL